ncbi:glycosyltransferase [Thermophagus sp. OGC60D27]|uniref:glycosyltransferase n=1 Tax=Thermophagus sp. OGC60D27 TaxID=3458415 RepID=UPI0040380A70
MEYLLVVIWVVLSIYCFLILLFFKGWKQLTPNHEDGQQKRNVFISVIIPYRDEAVNFEPLMSSLATQRMAHPFEVIMVDDGSADEGPRLLEKMRPQYPWLHLYRSDGVGKKEALRYGIHRAAGELMVTTDADCKLGSDWLHTIAGFYQAEKPDMIVMPVEFVEGVGSLGKFQQIDYLAMQMVTAGAAGIGRPVICSGANLAFRKKSFLEASQSMRGMDYLSGDDVFLLHAFKEHNFKISFLKSPQVLVKTFPATSPRGFLLQRMRWGGKSKQYKDRFTLITVVVVLLANFIGALMPLAAFGNLRMLFFWGIFMVLKMLVDWILLSAGRQLFSVRLPFFRFVSFSILYPYYILLAALGAVLVKERWKRRKGK